MNVINISPKEGDVIFLSVKIEENMTLADINNKKKEYHKLTYETLQQLKLCGTTLEGVPFTKVGIVVLTEGKLPLV